MDAPTITVVGSYSTHQDYYVRFFEEEFFVTVTPDSSVISRWIRNALYSHNRSSLLPLVVGVGVQWTPVSYISESQNNYNAGPPSVRYFNDGPPSVSYFNAGPPPASYFNPDPPADTLQLCVGNNCLIIQLRYCDQVPNDLRSFLTDVRAKYVGVWNAQDAGKLARSIHQLEIGELLDIRHYVNDSVGRSMNRCSFEEIVEVCLVYGGVRLDQEISTSDWTVPYLDDAQILHQLGVQTRLWQVLKQVSK